jgi:hypothetical protein
LRKEPTHSPTTSAAQGKTAGCASQPNEVMKRG